MALRTTPNEYTIELWKLNTDYLATDVGDIALLTTNVTTSVVNSLNNLQTQINAAVVGALSLNNNVWFTSQLFGGGTANIVKVNTSDNIEFGRNISGINIVGGTITSLSSPIPKSAGGTGGIDNASAQTSLGLLIGTNVQAWDANLDQIAALSPTLNNAIIGNGSAWTLATPAGFKTAMGLTVGTDIQAWSTRLDSISAITPNNDTFIAGNGSAWVSRTATDVRSILQLVVGTNVQAYHANLQNISLIGTPSDMFILSSNGGVIQAKSPLNIRVDLGLRLPADGSPTVQPYSSSLVGIASMSALNNYTLIGNGTNWISTDPFNARAALGLAIGTDVQAYSTHLNAIALGSKTLNNAIIADGTTYQSVSASAFRTAMNLTIGTHVQAWDINLDQIAALTPSVDNILIGNGSAWVLTSGAGARSSLGLAIGSNVQAWNTKLDQIAALTPSTNGILVWNGSAWVTQVGATARSSLGAAASGANTDITSIFFSGGDLNLAANSITISPANNVNCWRFGSDGHLVTMGGIIRDIGTAGANYPRNIYAQSFLPVGRPTDYNLAAFGYTRRVSLNAASATAQQVAEFALSIADDLQAIGIFGGS